MNRTFSATAFLAAVLLAGTPLASPSTVPTALSKYVVWRGGSNFEALKSLHQTGTTRLGAADGRIEQWLVRDGRMRRNRSLGPVADSRAINKESSWATNASGQVEDQGDGGEGDRRALTLAFADVGRADVGLQFEERGVETYDGRDWTVIRVRFAGEDTYDLLLDATTGELLGERITQDRATRFIHYGDWRFVSGVRVPFEEHVTSASAEAEEFTRFESVAVNSPPAAEVFARPQSARTWAFATGRHSTGWIPFEFFQEDQIFVPATINGRIGAKLGEAVPIGGTGGQSTMQLAPNLEIEIGELALHRITAGVMDLSQIAGQLGHPLPMILGKEVFNELIVDIDFPNRRIAFHEPGQFSIPAGGIRVPLGRHGENRTIPVSVEGRAAVDFDFDLGSNSPLIVYPAYRDSEHFLDGRLHSLGLSGGVGGMFKPACATIRYLVVGGSRLSNVPADFPDPANSAVNSDRTSGNVGLPVFSRFRLLTDYSHGAIWLVGDAKALGEPFRKNRTGLITTAAGDKLNVLMVAPGSPAERAGWKEGAQILAIDGHKIDAGYRNSPLSRWAFQASGTRVSLTLADGSIGELVLAEYF